MTVKKGCLLILLFLSFLSCGRKSNPDLEKRIIGDWVLIKVKSMKNHRFYPSPGYVFQKGGRVISNTLEKNEEGKIGYIDTKTKFKIERDSLLIFNPGSKKWDKTKIIVITKLLLKIENEEKDTLIFAKTF